MLMLLTEVVWLCVGVFFLGRRRVVFFFYWVSFFLVAALNVICLDDLYCAPSSGGILELNSRLFLYMSSLLWVDDSCLGEALFSLVFPVICYFHQIVMISVIKLRRVVGLADLHGVNVLFFCMVVWIFYRF